MNPSNPMKAGKIKILMNKKFKKNVRGDQIWYLIFKTNPISSKINLYLFTYFYL